MRYALVDGKKVEAERGITGAVCPSCGNSVRPNHGPQRRFWSHITKDCDSWYEDMTEWHINWQNLFPEQYREVIVGDHRADVMYKDYVFEFQHSFLSEEEIKEREVYYQNMMWIFDLREKYDKQQLKFFKMIDKTIHKEEFEFSPEDIMSYEKMFSCEFVSEDAYNLYFSFSVRKIAEAELNQIKINDSSNEIEEVFMQMIRPKETLLAVRSGSTNIEIAFDLGDNLIFLVNSYTDYKNNQLDIPHVIVSDYTKYHKYCPYLIFFDPEMQKFKGFYGKLQNKQKFIESVIK